MILFALSAIVILINKYVFHYAIAAKGSLLLQLIYGICIFSFMSIPVKAYNEYCDKKDAEKAKEKKEEERTIQKQKYFKILSYCCSEEINLLKKFLNTETNTIYLENDEDDYVKTLRAKGIDFIVICSSEHYRDDNICISVYGREILKEFFSSSLSK